MDETWVVPLRDAGGFSNKQHLTPSLERKLCCTAVETGSFEKAARLAAEWSCPVSDSTIHRCVSRLGKQAEEQPLCAPCADQAGAEDILVIMMDGWMARHRGRGWGFQRPAEGWDPVNWHEIKTAVIYCLNDRAEHRPNRASLLKKHVVATPAKTDPLTFGQRVHHEAKRMGMAQAKAVYVVMDGAVWLWNIFEDRFRALATGTLDFYHASEHLHALGDRLYANKEDARKWSSSLLKELRENRAPTFLSTLEELAVQSDRYPADTAESIRQTKAYFEKHSEHMAYAKAEAQVRYRKECLK